MFICDIVCATYIRMYTAKKKNRKLNRFQIIKFVYDLKAITKSDNIN